MQIQTVFKRYEIKYVLTRQQKKEIMKLLERYMVPDAFGESTIRNLYYDTDTYRLARRSIENPVYKEKLRVRSYKKVTGEDTVFVELKKKYCSVVYKRRLTLPETETMNWLAGGKCPVDGQIANEINYFLEYYKTLHPVSFISYDRQAFFSAEDDSFRISFDENIRSRQDTLSLTTDPGGNRLLDEGLVLMEIKTAGAIPLWLTDFLTDNQLYKTSFSKYGKAYTDYIYLDKINSNRIQQEMYQGREELRYA